MSDWKEYKLRDLVTFSQGIQVPVEEQSNVRHSNMGRFVRIVDFTNPDEEPRFIKIKDSKYWVNKKDVVMIRYGSATAGKVVRGLEGYIANNMFKVIPNKSILNEEFLYYFLSQSSIYSYLMNSQSSSTMPAIKFSDFDNIKIKLPSLDIQKHIVLKLNRLNDKIELNTQINQTLEQIAQSLFKSWFVDFDPVRAKVQALSDGLSLEQAELAAMQAISGKTPEELTALSQTQPEHYAELAETAKAFPCEMMEVDGVEVPKGWKQTTLSEICEMQNGYAFKSSEWTDTGIPVIKIGSIQSKILTVEGNGFVSEDNLSLRSNFVLNGGDIVIGLTGAYVGKVGRMPANKKAMLNQRVAKFLAKRINESETFYSFIYMNIIQEDFKNFVDFTAQGSAQPNISTRDILKYPLLLANTEVHLVFEKLLKKTLDKSIFNSYQNEILSNSRDLLLPRLLGGENYE